MSHVREENRHTLSQHLSIAINSRPVCVADPLPRSDTVDNLVHFINSWTIKLIAGRGKVWWLIMERSGTKLLSLICGSKLWGSNRLSWTFVIVSVWKLLIVPGQAIAIWALRWSINSSLQQDSKNSSSLEITLLLCLLFSCFHALWFVPQRPAFGKQF